MTVTSNRISAWVLIAVSSLYGLGSAALIAPVEAADSACGYGASSGDCAQGYDSGGESADVASTRVLIVRPEGKSQHEADVGDLERLGERLFADRSLSDNGLACISCHAGMNLYNSSFTEPYPHRVTMPFERAGLDTVDAESMVQFCMVFPMAADPLPWQSRQLAALSAYVEKVQREYADAVR
ncbi:MAG: hypothetical protein AAF499_06000 [Pseudomonadota bacterium]